MTYNELEPTIVSKSVSSATGASADVSRADVGFVVGSRPKFADETADLLRRRLTAATLALGAALAAALLGSLIIGASSLWWLRVVILVFLGSCFLGLRSQRSFSLSQLRVIELVVFGLVVAQLSLMLMTRIGGFAADKDITSGVAIKYLFLGAWCLLILIYGIFMPNTWKRGAAVMVPVAFVPYAILALQSWLSPEVARLLAEEKLLSPIPLPIVAALVGVYGTHIINTARREAFKARQFGQYRLLEKLGSGGMGEVYKAEHVLLKRPCAMKLIKSENEADAAALARFEKEVQTTSKLTHWNTIEIYDYGHTEDGTFYYVMELLPGKSLEELVEQHGPLPAGRVVHLLRQVCDALQEAHDVGLIHRDIKPANIFAAQRGGFFDVAKLLDFGLVKERSGRPGDGDEPSCGSFSGTPLYMSPEQALAYEDVDGRADIYSLGAVAYYLLTGNPPFSGMNVVDLLRAHAGQEVAPPSTLNVAVPGDVERVVLRCLEKNPAARFTDAASLGEAFGACECAVDWTKATAAAWWAQDREIKKRSDPTETQLIDVTIDLKRDDAPIE
jgi:serine/threonine-protein kinase